MVWAYLTLQTVTTLGEEAASSADREGFKAQQTVWHNLLAIWLWRYLLSAVESISIPGLISVMSLIVFYVPSWFLWSTAFMFAMLVTPKTEEKRVRPGLPPSLSAVLTGPQKANSWYARWLLGGFGKTATAAPAKPSSESRSRGSGSGGDGSGSRR